MILNYLNIRLFWNANLPLSDIFWKSIFLGILIFLSILKKRNCCCRCRLSNYRTFIGFLVVPQKSNSFYFFYKDNSFARKKKGHQNQRAFCLHDERKESITPNPLIMSYPYILLLYTLGKRLCHIKDGWKRNKEIVLFVCIKSRLTLYNETSHSYSASW